MEGYGVTELFVRIGDVGSDRGNELPFRVSRLVVVPVRKSDLSRITLQSLRRSVSEIVDINVDTGAAADEALLYTDIGKKPEPVVSVHEIPFSEIASLNYLKDAVDSVEQLQSTGPVLVHIYSYSDSGAVSNNKTMKSEAEEMDAKDDLHEDKCFVFGRDPSDTKDSDNWLGKEEELQHLSDLSRIVDIAPETEKDNKDEDENQNQLHLFLLPDSLRPNTKLKFQFLHTTLLNEADGRTKYTAYVIQLTQYPLQWVVHKRYSQFESLHAALVSQAKTGESCDRFKLKDIPEFVKKENIQQGLKRLSIGITGNKREKLEEESKKFEERRGRKLAAYLQALLDLMIIKAQARVASTCSLNAFTSLKFGEADESGESSTGSAPEDEKDEKEGISGQNEILLGFLGVLADSTAEVGKSVKAKKLLRQQQKQGKDKHAPLPIHISDVVGSAGVGDILLFRTPSKLRMNFMASILRGTTLSEFDHCALVIPVPASTPETSFSSVVSASEPDGPTGLTTAVSVSSRTSRTKERSKTSSRELYLLEASVQGITVLPLQERLEQYEKFHMCDYVCIRRLRSRHRNGARNGSTTSENKSKSAVVLSSTRLARLNSLVQRVQNMKYGWNLSNVFFAPKIAKLENKSTRLGFISREGEGGEGILWSSEVDMEEHRVEKEGWIVYQGGEDEKVEGQGEEQEDDELESESAPDPDSLVKESAASTISDVSAASEGPRSKIFCSALVSAGLKALGVLPEKYNDNYFWPGSFCSGAAVDRILCSQSQSQSQTDNSDTDSNSKSKKNKDKEKEKDKRRFDIGTEDENENENEYYYEQEQLVDCRVPEIAAAIQVTKRMI